MQTEFWISMDEAAGLFGYSNVDAALNAVYAGRFPVPTYKVGRRRVVDREVVRQFFETKRTESLAASRLNQK